MRRMPGQPRPDWQKTVESQGMFYHTVDGVPYWDESAYYQFTPPEIDVDGGGHLRLGRDVPGRRPARRSSATSWTASSSRAAVSRLGPPFLGRGRTHDLRPVRSGFDGAAPPKLLEYNADTPTALLEAAVIQWFWLQDCLPDAAPVQLDPRAAARGLQASCARQTAERFHFAAMADCLEDYMTVNYLRDVAIQAGFDTSLSRRRADRLARRPRRLHRPAARTRSSSVQALSVGVDAPRTVRPAPAASQRRWFEPPWKTLLSNKAILPLLWELYPRHPNLLETALRAAARRQLCEEADPGPRGCERPDLRARQALPGRPRALTTARPSTRNSARCPALTGRYFALIGSWMVNGWACGIGIREDESLITGNLSRFVPHVFAANVRTHPPSPPGSISRTPQSSAVSLPNRFR